GSPRSAPPGATCTQLSLPTRTPTTGKTCRSVRCRPTGCRCTAPTSTARHSIGPAVISTGSTPPDWVARSPPGKRRAWPGGLTCRSIPVPHDCDPTFAFRIDGPVGLFGPQWSVGYAADLGVAPPELIEAFADVNVLAIEFNHCEQMEQASGRPWFLIRR